MPILEVSVLYRLMLYNTLPFYLMRRNNSATLKRDVRPLFAIAQVLARLSSRDAFIPILCDSAYMLFSEAVDEKRGAAYNIARCLHFSS